MRLPLSFFTVSSVVEQGQCMTVKMRTQTAHETLQPEDARTADTESSCESTVEEEYIIAQSGSTISFND